MSQFIVRAGSSIAAATLFGAFLSLVPLHESRAQQADQPMQTTAPHAKGGMLSADRAERRIRELHEKLGITQEQEGLWGTVAQTMRDNGKTFETSMADRSARLKDKNLTAVDDLKSFQVIADQHADGLKRLIPAFEELYAAMTPDQQKRADHVFGEHQRHAHMSHM